MSTAAVLVPIKAFDAAKSRLAPALEGPARTALARMMATQVLDACAPLDAFVATDDERVAAWAMAAGAGIVWTAGLDLNGSVAAGVDAMRDEGYERLVVAHADLPFATDLGTIATFPGATLVPDRRDDGTNVLVVPAAIEFVPMYGPGSFSRHLVQLRAAGVPVRICRRADLAWDVDVPADLPDTLLPPVSATA